MARCIAAITKRKRKENRKQMARASERETSPMQRSKSRDDANFSKRISRNWWRYTVTSDARDRSQEVAAPYAYKKMETAGD